jgi:phage-related protein
MITDTDITKIKESLKEDFSLRADMMQGFREVGQRFEQTDEKIDTIAQAVGRIENTLDGIVGAIQDLRTENGAGAVHLVRHDRQIEALAHATHTTLPD